MDIKDNIEKLLSKGILKKEFYLQPTQEVAINLLGKILMTIDSDGQIIAGKIVETEAYLNANDKASHSHSGITNRNEAMFEGGGVLYVYRSYGIHHCINVVTEAKGKGAAVLIRAMEPIEGLDLMKVNRGIDDIEKLCKGPGNTAKAFGFTKIDNFRSLTSYNLFIIAGEDISENDIISTKRVGISQSKDLLLRFYIKNSNFVSRK